MAAITTAVVVGASAVYSGVQQRRAAQATARSQRAQQRQADLQNARERRAVLRNARVQRASIEAQGAATGLTGSSAVAAATSNVTSRSNENVSFLDQSGYLANKASAANAAAADYSSRAAMGSTIGNLASTAYDLYGRNRGGSNG